MSQVNSYASPFMLVQKDRLRKMEIREVRIFFLCHGGLSARLSRPPKPWLGLQLWEAQELPAALSE